LQSVIRAKAGILVTDDDKDLLDVSEDVSQLNIISPREIWELLKE